MKTRRDALTLASAAGAAACLPSVAAAQDIGLFMNPFEEKMIGKSGHPRAVKEGGGHHPKADLRQYINRLGVEAANAVARYPDEFTFSTLNDGSFNAVTRPGGYVYFYAGIIPWFYDESELMAIMGHEVGHAIRRHSAREFARSSVRDRLIARAERRRRGREDPDLDKKKVESWLAIKEYSREQEFEVDDIALQVLMKTGRDPHGAQYGLLRLLSYGRVMEAMYGPSTQPVIVRTHPPSIDRVRRAAAKVKEMGIEADADKRFRGRFLKTINGMTVPGTPLTLDKPYKVYVYQVEEGDTVESLAVNMQTHAKIKEMLFRAVNGLGDDKVLKVGDYVKIFGPI